MKSKIFTATTLLLTTLSFNAIAEIPPGTPFVEGSFALTSYDTDGSIKIDDSTGIRLLGGYHITLDEKRSISPEISYTAFGETKFKGNSWSKVKVTALGIGAKGNYAISNNIDIFGRLAILRASLTSNANDIDGTTDTDILFGFGGEYHLDKLISLNAAYEIFNSDDKINTLRFGGIYRF